MLSNSKVRPTFPASDMDRAKKFYGDTLGFKKVDENPGGVTYSAGEGSEFLVFPSKNAGSNPSTYAGFRTNDIEAEVADLKKRGVEVIDYDTDSLKTVNGVATIGPIKAAWFKDSEGNTLGVVQMS